MRRHSHLLSRFLLVLAIGAGLASIANSPDRPKASTQVSPSASVAPATAMEREQPEQCLRALPRASEDEPKIGDKTPGKRKKKSIVCG